MIPARLECDGNGKRLIILVLQYNLYQRKSIVIGSLFNGWGSMAFRTRRENDLRT